MQDESNQSIGKSLTKYPVSNASYKSSLLGDGNFQISFLFCHLKIYCVITSSCELDTIFHEILHFIITYFPSSLPTSNLINCCSTTTITFLVQELGCRDHTTNMSQSSILTPCIIIKSKENSRESTLASTMAKMIDFTRNLTCSPH